jgi:hypothetical protein
MVELVAMDGEIREKVGIQGAALPAWGPSSAHPASAKPVDDFIRTQTNASRQGHWMRIAGKYTGRATSRDRFAGAVRIIGCKGVASLQQTTRK